MHNQKVLTKCLIWLVAEILLTSIGIDDIAHYREFVFERHRLALRNSQQVVIFAKDLENFPQSYHAHKSSTAQKVFY